MSSIEKLMIQGIRSFGPEDKDRGFIQFYTPLTLILGPNGTGKTTIIECLRYITTGDMPPGSLKGAAFIHDPKIAHESIVKAKVKLLFRDVKGESVVVERAVEATQKKAGVSLRTLEGVITRKKADGSTTSVSARCADMDREYPNNKWITLKTLIAEPDENGEFTNEDGDYKNIVCSGPENVDAKMVTLLGVSKPVLDSVIFCHQEESNWPLSEGKALKTRFDDIFASTRYVKVLDSITKERKAQSTKVSECRIEIKHLRTHKEKAEEYTENLAEKEGAYEAATGTIASMEDQLKPIEDKLEQIDERLTDIHIMNTEIEKLKSKRKEMEKTIKEIRDQIENLFEGSTEELRDSLEKFDDELDKKTRDLEQVTAKLRGLGNKLEQLSREKQELLVQKGKLEQAAEHHKKQVTNRDDLLRDISDELSLSGFRGHLDERKVADFLGVMENKAAEQLQHAKHTKGESEEREAALQKEIDAKNKEKTELTTTQHIKNDTIKKNRQEIRSIHQQLANVAASGDKLKHIERDLKRAEADLTQAEKSVNLAELKEEISALQAEKTRRTTQLSEIDALVGRMSREAESRTKLDMLSKDKTSKDDAVKRLKAKSGDALQQLLGSVPEEGLARQLDRKMQQQSREMRSLNQRLDNMRREKATLEAQKKNFKEQLKAKEDEVRADEEKISSVCEDADVEESIVKVQSQQTGLQDNKGHLLGTERVFKRYTDKLKRPDDPPCPLCHRPFDTKEEIQDLIAELENKLDMLPEKLEEADSKIVNNQKYLESLYELRPTKQKVDNIKQKQVPKIKSKLQEVTEKFDKISSEVTETEDSKEVYTVDESLAKSIQGDVTMIDRYQAEIRDLQRKIEETSSKLSTSDSSKTLQEVQTERDDAQLALGTVDMNLDSKKNKRQEQNEHLQRLRETINDHNAKKLRIESELQKRVQLEQTRDQLEKDVQRLKEEVEDGADLIAPLQEEIKDLMSQKDKVSAAKERCWEEDRGKYQNLRQKKDSVESLNNEVRKYKAQGNTEKLERIQGDVNKLEQRAGDVSEEATQLQGRQDGLRQTLDEQKTRQRELTDNLSWRKKDEDIRVLGEQIRQKEERMGGLDVNNLARQRSQLSEKRQQYTNNLYQQKGRQGELKSKIKELKTTLNEDTYKHAESRYQGELIKLRTTEMVMTDLDKYHRALDKAIMSYHKTKMDEINKIIRELWRNTYKGHDIETIEIQSDEDTKATTATSRKSYNYRVVMIKGDNTALDMRGRCSAGQKVLASLIIRLALAETFCLNCGILALDEPTTNLDRENIESLAYALEEIIKARAGQKNFQLVVITHDEDFVELLGRSEHVEEFFKVRKNMDGLSTLVKAKVQDLHTR